MPQFKLPFLLYGTFLVVAWLQRQMASLPFAVNAQKHYATIARQVADNLSNRTNRYEITMFASTTLQHLKLITDHRLVEQIIVRYNFIPIQYISFERHWNTLHCTFNTLQLTEFCIYRVYCTFRCIRHILSTYVYSNIFCIS